MCAKAFQRTIHSITITLSLSEERSALAGWATDRAAERDEDDASGLAASGVPAAADLREEDREGDLLGPLPVGLGEQRVRSAARFPLATIPRLDYS